jgi:hypothetical protein
MWLERRDAALAHLLAVRKSFFQLILEEDDFPLAPVLWMNAVQHRVRLMDAEVGDDLDAIMESWAREDIRLRGFYNPEAVLRTLRG